MPGDCGTTDASNRSGRPWYRLHLSTWVVAVLMAAVLVVLVAPGQSGGVSSFGPQWETFEHGWPWLHLRRTIENPPGLREYPTWLYRDAWGFAPDLPEFTPISWRLAPPVYEFSPGKLAGNLAIALLILVVAVAGFEWRRRRTRLWQFSLRELLTVTLLVAIALAWWQWRCRRFQREQQAIATVRELLVTDESFYDPIMVQGYCGPKWLRRLVGAKPLGVLSAATDLEFYNVSDAQLQQVRPCLESMHYVEQLFFSGDEVTDKGLECFSRMTSLQSLCADGARITDEGLVHLSRLKNLRELRLWDSDITGTGFKHLGGLSRLRQLDLSSSKLDDRGLEAVGILAGLRELNIQRTQVTSAGMAHVARLKNLEQLDLDDTAVDDRGMAHLAALDGLKKFSLTNTQVTDAGLAHLKRMKSLERLWLPGQVTDAAVVHLERLASLQYLGLHDTEVTQKSVERLQRALPDCEIGWDTSSTPKQGGEKAPGKGVKGGELKGTGVFNLDRQ